MPLKTYGNGCLFPLLPIILTIGCLMAAGCQEVETIKRELLKKVEDKVRKKKHVFTPRDGITIRPCSLYQAANPNSEVVSKLPAETTVHLVDKIGEWYRVKTREGREGYLDQKVVGGEDIIVKTQELRKSIEGIPVQAEGVIKSQANFRLEPGRQHTILEVLPAGKKFEMYERIVTLRRQPEQGEKTSVKGSAEEQEEPEDPSAVSGEFTDESVKKDVWYKVKIEDGRVGYVYTHNLKFTPPEDVARMVPFLRLLAWRTVNTTDDPDMGAKNNYLVAYAPIGKDPGSDYTRLYFMAWSKKQKRLVIGWQKQLPGILPLTDFHYEGKPGFSVRYLHPTKKDYQVMSNYVISKSGIQKVSEEELRRRTEFH